MQHYCLCWATKGGSQLGTHRTVLPAGASAKSARSPGSTGPWPCTRAVNACGRRLPREWECRPPVCGAVTQRPSWVRCTPLLAVSAATKWPGLSVPPAHPRVPWKVSSRVLASQSHVAVAARPTLISAARAGFPARQSRPQGQPRGPVPPPCGLGLDQSLLPLPLLPAPAGDACAALHPAETGSDLGSGLDVLVPRRLPRVPEGGPP